MDGNNSWPRIRLPVYASVYLFAVSASPGQEVSQQEDNTGYPGVSTPPGSAR